MAKHEEQSKKGIKGNWRIEIPWEKDLKYLKDTLKQHERKETLFNFANDISIAQMEIDSGANVKWSSAKSYKKPSTALYSPSTPHLDCRIRSTHGIKESDGTVEPWWNCDGIVMESGDRYVTNRTRKRQIYTVIFDGTLDATLHEHNTWWRRTLSRARTFCGPSSA